MCLIPPLTSGTWGALMTIASVNTKSSPEEKVSRENLASSEKI